VAHTIGPASTMPTAASSQRLSSDTPEATTPQPNAHIGGNHVMGFSNSATADKAGRAMATMLPRAATSVNLDLHPK
jgi:hypothetical protein